MSRSEARRQLGLESDGRLLLLPASRPQELNFLMPVLAQVAQLQERDPELSVIVPAGLNR